MCNKKPTFSSRCLSASCSANSLASSSLRNLSSSCLTFSKASCICLIANFPGFLPFFFSSSSLPFFFFFFFFFFFSPSSPSSSSSLLSAFSPPARVQPSAKQTSKYAFPREEYSKRRIFQEKNIPRGVIWLTAASTVENMPYQQCC